MPLVRPMNQVGTITGKLLAKRVITRTELVPLKADHNCPIKSSKGTVLALTETVAIQTNEEARTLQPQVSNKHICNQN